MCRRPSARRVLAHPFLTGKKTQRLHGETAEYDAFISYRVASDFDHAARLYHLLTARGLKIWWDRVSLQPGVPWEEAFCEGMMKCRSFIPLLSRSALKSFENLNEQSNNDNVLLEYRMAQELRAAGFIEKIFPVMIGDRETFIAETEMGGIETFYMYNDYLQNGCHPSNVPKSSISAVENKLRLFFDKTVLGAPFITERSVADILADIMANQGGFVKGRLSADLLITSFTDKYADVLIKLEGSDLSKEYENENDAFSGVVESIVKMLDKGMGKEKKKKVTEDFLNESSLSFDGFNNDFQGFDVFTPGVLKNIGVGGEMTPGNSMMLEQRITSVEKQIAYLNTMLKYLYDEKKSMNMGDISSGSEVVGGLNLEEGK